MLMGVKLHVRRTEREHTVVIKKKKIQEGYSKTKVGSMGG